MNASESEKYALSHSGNHHLAEAKYDPSTGKISVGTIYSFSDNAASSVQIVGGKTTETFVHTGDTHKTRIDLDNNGTFNGSFEDKANGLKIGIQGGVAKVVSGKVPVDGIAITADHHIVKLKLDESNRLCGSIESQDTKYGTFKINLDQGRVSGSLTHLGDGHEETILISPDGKYKASISSGSNDSKLSLSVENGDAGVKAFAGIELKF